MKFIPNVINRIPLIHKYVYMLTVLLLILILSFIKIYSDIKLSETTFQRHLERMNTVQEMRTLMVVLSDWQKSFVKATSSKDKYLAKRKVEGSIKRILEYITTIKSSFPNSNSPMDYESFYKNIERYVENSNEVIKHSNESGKLNILMVRYRSLYSILDSQAYDLQKSSLVTANSINSKRFISLIGYLFIEILFLALLSVVVIINVIRRQVTEESLSETQNYLDDVINSMPSILIGVTLDGTITQWNAQAERIFGVPSEIAVGCEFVKIAPRFEPQVPGINEAIISKEVRTKTKQRHIVDGKAYYEDITIYPLNAEGIQGAVIRIDDVTNQVKVDSMMIQTEKIRSLGGLAAGMAHEINNPLAIISQGIHNVIRRLDPERPKNIEAAASHGVNLNALHNFLAERRIKVFLSNCLDAVERAAGIVRNMLMFSRRSDSSPSVTNLNELIEHTIELGSTDYDMKKRYDFKFIEIVKDYDPAIHDVMCCAAEIEQVLLNLFKNALQAMEEIERDDYKPLFHVRTRNEETHVRIEIEDNGPGISDSIKSRIFEPFYTTKAVGVGTGLGLSVSYIIITQNHSGTFEVESEYGKYTRFIIRLPINTS